MSPRKVGVVASLVRGRTVADALVILDHTPRRSAVAVKKAVASARANADHNHNLKPDSLRIVEISVTPSPPPLQSPRPRPRPAVPAQDITYPGRGGRGNAPS
jgi:ribosomal protein L22